MIDLTYDIQEKVYDTLSSFLEGAIQSPISEVSWKPFNDSLTTLQIPQSSIDVISYWASNTIHHIHGKSFPYRVLHDMERELITPDAYGFMLESIRLGFIETTQTEFLLEELALKEHLPISLPVMKRTMVKNWFKTIHDSGIKKSH